MTITSLKEYFQELEKIDPLKTMIYRGESEIFNTSLIPKFGRKIIDKEYHPDLGFIKEQFIFNKFKNSSISHLDQLERSQLDLLMIAQHYGLATRLLDFSLNPLVALYFAVCNNTDKKGFIFISDERCLLSSKYDRYNELKDFYKSINGFTCILPPQFDKRIISQSSVYICGNNPRKKFDRVHNTLIIENKEKILEELKQVNISDYSLMKDLENLTQNLN